MASDVMTLFNMPSAQDTRRAYLESQMVSPTQLGSQGLFQQAVSLGANRGAILGEGAGRLFGGMAPQEARSRGIEEAMMKVQGMGLTSDAEMYSALSKELASRGLTQDAFMANKEARTAMRDEQLIKKGGVDIQLGNAQLKKLEQDMLGLEEQLGIAMSQGKEDRVNDLKRQLEDKKRAAALVNAQIQGLEAKAKADVMNAEANKARAGRDDEKFTQAIYEEGVIPGTKGATPIGYRSPTTGRIRDLRSDGVYDNLDQLKQARMLRGEATTTPNTTPEKNKPTMSIEERAAQLNAGQGQTSAAPAAPAVDTARYTRTKNNRGQYVYTYSPRGGKTKAEWATIE